MAHHRLSAWESLFRRALDLLDSTVRAGVAIDEWSFGGGTVLMRRHHHRFSKDIDIFLPDPQYLGYLTPRLNSVAESLTTKYVEQATSLKLIFEEGEIDFVASAPLTERPTQPELILERVVQVETSTEIVGKKLWHRGDQFTARDIFDLAMVMELERDALLAIEPVLRDRRRVVLDRIQSHGVLLRQDFDALEVLDYHRTYDECVDLVTRALG